MANDLIFSGNVGAHIFADPHGLSGASPAGGFWRDIKISGESTQFDRYKYPGYDAVITKKMGLREGFVAFSVIWVGGMAACDQAVDIIGREIRGAVCNVTMPDGTVYPRALVTNFQTMQRTMPWRTGVYYILCDGSFEPLEASQ